MQPWFIELAESIADGSPRYFECPDCGSASLPPRSVCSNCGSRTLNRQELSRSATVVASTEIHISIPRFREDVPYSIVLGEFDEGLRLTGRLEGTETIESGERVSIEAKEIEEEQWILTYSPIE